MAARDRATTLRLNADRIKLILYLQEPGIHGRHELLELVKVVAIATAGTNPAVAEVGPLLGRIALSHAVDGILGSSTLFRILKGLDGFGPVIVVLNG